VKAQLWRGDQEIGLRRKTFDVLLYLVDHPGQLVTKGALLDAIWAEVSVSDSMPANCVVELRKALDDQARTPRFIETVHGRGYRFVAKVTTAAPAETIRKPQSVPKSPKLIMVGREDELAQLRSWYSHVLEGQRRVVFVAGEAGIGKTTFVQAFLDSVAEEGTGRLGRGQCVEQYGAGEPYMPVLEALSRLGLEPGGERVIELLRKFAPTWLAQMPSLLDDTDNQRLQTAAQGVTQQRMLREMAQALEALAAEAPLVLLLEDLHWGDFSTLELISATARRSEPARLLIVGTYRPVELANNHPLRTMKQELELHRYCEESRLKLLNEEGVAGYLAKRFSSNGSRRFDSLAPVIHERTDGNPLFMVNVVDYLVDAGLLSNEASVAKSAETLRADRFDAPRSIRQMIERNLERLKPEEQTVLEGASVAGAEFSAAAVALERPQTEVEACCTRLSRHEQFVTGQGPIAWPDGTVAAGFRFDHALYQEVLYSRLPAGHRVQLHRLIAVREETGYGERAAEVATELAHHYCCAYDRNKAIQYFQLAGERAAARGAVVEAEGHYRRALELLGELPKPASAIAASWPCKWRLGAFYRCR
jgi:predicted ATPase